MELEQLKGMLADSEAAYTVFADRVRSTEAGLQSVDAQMRAAEDQDDSQWMMALSGQREQLLAYMESVRAGISQRMSVLDGLAGAFQQLAGSTQAAKNQLGLLSERRFGSAAARAAGTTAGVQHEACIRGVRETRELEAKYASLLRSGGVS